VDLRHLRYFTAVAEELHFGRAARRLGVSQPPLSRQIGELERELGAKLLTRTSHRVELTPAGTALLAESREIAAALERAKATVRGVATQPAGLLRIGFIQAIGWPLRASILRNVVTRYPAIAPSLEPMSTAEQLRAIRERQLDVGVIWYVRGGLEAKATFERLILSEVQTVLGLPIGHPLAGRKRISVEQLANQTLIMAHRRENPEIHDHLIAVLRRNGIAPNMLYRHGSGIIEMVAAGIGVAFVASTGSLAKRPDIVIRPFTQPVMPVYLALIWLQGNQLPSLKGFLEVVNELKESGQLS
jgi:DNA-binding transcriptional LysR family regulator